MVFGGLWVAFGAGIILSQGSVDAAWHWLGDLRLVLQAIVWLLFLPVTAGLWIWEQAWPFAIRLVLDAGLAGWSILMFLPKAAGKP